MRPDPLARRGRDQHDRAVSAIHVDHGIHEQSPRWATQCRELCAEIGIPLEVIKVDARPRRRESPEDAARKARYRAFASVLAEGDVLALAHHRDDQAETVLLQLLRGAGPAGLAAMPRLGRLGNAWTWRPFIDLPRDALRQYGRDKELRSANDPANDDLSVDRSFLRHAVMPLLRKRWPGADSALARAASNCADANTLGEQIAAQDLRAAGGCSDHDPMTLGVDTLLAHRPERRRNLIRFWLRQLGLATPSAAHLARIEADLLDTPADRRPCVEWAGTQIRRYRGRLHAMHKLPRLPLDFHAPIAENTRVQLPDGSWAVLGRGGTLDSAALARGDLRVGYRRGGEHLKPRSSCHRRSLKQLYQESGIPPWERDARPLLWVGAKLVAVAGLWVDTDYMATNTCEGLHFAWQRPDPSDTLGRP